MTSTQFFFYFIMFPVCSVDNKNALMCFFFNNQILSYQKVVGQVLQGKHKIAQENLVIDMQLG